MTICKCNELKYEREINSFIICRMNRSPYICPSIKNPIRIPTEQQ